MAFGLERHVFHRRTGRPGRSSAGQLAGIETPSIKGDVGAGQRSSRTPFKNATAVAPCFRDASPAGFGPFRPPSCEGLTAFP